MENQQILKQIENLKGRRAYEEKRAAKLGFTSLYAYFEHKLQESNLAAEAKAVLREELSIKKSSQKRQRPKKRKTAAAADPRVSTIFINGLADIC